jgi:hypothetical protein
MAGKVRMVDRVPLGSKVTVPLGNKLQNGWYRLIVRAGGTPDPRHESHAIGHLDVDVLVLPDLMRQERDLSHQAVGTSSSISNGSAWTHRSYFSVSSASSCAPM